jgi:hypothetical protein
VFGLSVETLGLSVEISGFGHRSASVCEWHHTMCNASEPAVPHNVQSRQRLGVRCEPQKSTQGPWWGYFKSQFQLDLLTFDDISTQKRTNGSKHEHGIPPRRTFCGYSEPLARHLFWSTLATFDRSFGKLGCSWRPFDSSVAGFKGGQL